MDNGPMTSNDSLCSAYPKLKPIFSEHRFDLQEFNTNDKTLKYFQMEDFKEFPSETKLLGIH